jgi:hypothetical protein
MNPGSKLKRAVDMTGIGLLAIFLFLSLAFRASSISFMNPGFPILSPSDWNPMPFIALHWNNFPQRITSKEKFNEVAYYSTFQLGDNSQMFPNPFEPTRIEPTSFSGHQMVIRYSTSNHALSAMQNNYEEYRATLKPHQILITEIPGLYFSSRADKYYIWCEQVTPERSVIFNAEKVDGCYYRAVYGRYYSELRFSMWPFRDFGRQFSVELFNDVLNRADNKLVNAPK